MPAPDFIEGARNTQGLLQNKLLRSTIHLSPLGHTVHPNHVRRYRVLSTSSQLTPATQKRDM